MLFVAIGCSSPETKPLKIRDIFSFCLNNDLELYDSIDWSDLCPVTALIWRASTLWSDKTVTDVALTQWFVRYGTIPAARLIVFIILPRVDSPTGEFVYHTSSFSGWNEAQTYLGRWNRYSTFGVRFV